jgi:monooxygenase
MASENSYDFLILGAGVSGIGCAHYLKGSFPYKSLKILEGRSSMGGTWDLFRYPGIRSDSSMYTYSYSFNPWTGKKNLADGPAIREYVKATAKKFHIDGHIQYDSHVTLASWSSDLKKWTVTVNVKNQTTPVVYTTQFLFFCTGYYDYDQGYFPKDIPNLDQFQGPIFHPLKWPENFDYKNKRIILVGSGATSVTLLPVLAAEAKMVTMLQRSPTYIISQPNENPVARTLQMLFPLWLAHTLMKWMGRYLSLILPISLFIFLFLINCF